MTERQNGTRRLYRVDPDGLAELREYLDGQHREGRLVYGMHRSREALLTCIVFSYNGNHVHFVDGSDGGYAIAARGLKAQLKSLRAAPTTAP